MLLFLVLRAGWWGVCAGSTVFLVIIVSSAMPPPRAVPIRSAAPAPVSGSLTAPEEPPRLPGLLGLLFGAVVVVAARAVVVVSG
jgi:hypothetical protein